MPRREIPFVENHFYNRGSNHGAIFFKPENSASNGICGHHLVPAIEVEMSIL